ncbi:MAG TPA: ABC transporter permease, partial [Aestuariivirgaceae bacterium]|nr:ABC transporter permease [Aestuariivirgaceae bacterium]
MRLVLERRSEHSQAMAVLSPVIAIGLTLLAGAAIFALRGLDPLYALYIYFIDPLTSLWSLEQLAVKATPLILIGAGLAVCFTANVWNIGAEGQFTMGAVFASMVPILFTGWQSPLALAAMMALGCLGGMAWAAIPAVLKTRFGASEIL